MSRQRDTSMTDETTCERCEWSFSCAEPPKGGTHNQKEQAAKRAAEGDCQKGGVAIDLSTDGCTAPREHIA